MDDSEKDSSDVMRERLELFISEVLSDPKRFVHITQHYVGSKMYPGIVLSFVSCPDAVAKELHSEIDGVVNRTLASHGIGVRKPS